VPIIHCPSCDDPVEIDDDWYGRRIACPSCEHKFTPRRAGRGEREDDRPRRSRDRDAEWEDDRPRRRRSRDDDGPPKKKGGVLWIVLTLVGVFVVLPCVGCIGFVVWVGTAKETFAGPWADHTVGANAEVTASFPHTPSTKYLTVSGSSTTDMKGYSNLNDGDKPLDAEMAVGYVDYPAGTVGPLEKGYPEIRREIEDRLIDNPLARPTVSRETSTTVSGYPAKEAVYSEDDGGYTLRVIHVTGRPPGSTVRLVVVFAGGLALKEEDKQKFLNSVKIGKK
jgi:hypothetical protein